MRRRAPGALLLLALTAGCGSGTTAGPPTAESASPPASVTSEPWVEIDIVTGTAAGGEVSPEPVRVDTQQALDAYVAQFERSDLADRVVAAVAGADLPEGWVPVVAVISVGCDVPPGIVVDTSAGLSVVGQEVIEPLRECFAAMTSVAVLGADPAVL